MAETFAEFTIEIDADDSALKATLSRDEKLVRQSQKKMQRSMDKLSVSAAGVGRGAFDATRGVSALTNSATLLGGAMGSTLGQGVAMIEMMRNVKLATAGTSLAFLGPAGLILGVVAFREEIASSITTLGVWLGLMEDAEKITEDFAKTSATREAERAFAGGLKAIEDKIAVIRGTLTVEQARGRELVRGGALAGEAGQIVQAEAALRLATQTAAADKASAEAAKQKRIAQRATNLGLRRELFLLESGKPAYVLLADSRERELRAAVALEQRNQRLTALAESEAKARAATTRSMAQQLAIAAGIAKPSAFIGDPTQRRIQQLIEQLGGVSPGGGAGGFSIGFRQFSPATLRGLAETGGTFGEQQGERTNRLLEGIEKTIQVEAKKLLREVMGGGFGE